MPLDGGLIVSVQPATYNLSIQRNADYKLRITIKNPDGTPMNLTGATLYAQAWDKARENQYIDFTIVYVNRPGGVAEITLDSADTESIPCECFWDLMLEDSTGFKQYYLEGMVFTSQGYTAP
jgi:hypothetical protein